MKDNKNALNDYNKGLETIKDCARLLSQKKNIIGFFGKFVVPQKRPAPISVLFPPARKTRTVFQCSVGIQSHTAINKIKIAQIIV